MNETLHRTPLFAAHQALGAKIVPFAGYEMPVQYSTGVMAEHNWTRENAGLFDVSHMGQCFIIGRDFEKTAAAMEKIVPADILGLAPRQQRYSQILNEDGGILDDLMITRHDTNGWLYVVVNASRKKFDFERFAAHLPRDLILKIGEDLSLLALQGPKAEAVMAQLVPAISSLAFMTNGYFDIAGIRAAVSRSGYTGEDGFEISVPSSQVSALWNLLLENPLVKPIGLGARDSLRLEAGLCLYGHDIDETTSPVEAALTWSIAKRRRMEGGFFGAARVQRELASGVSRKRVGIKPVGKAPARDGTEIQNMKGEKIGTITSGGFGPTVGGPIAMGYVATAFSEPGTEIQLMVRGQAMPAHIAKLPFTPKRFKA
ncbi:MAG: glycine cleavage system aminomethyltransferase GcvT [Alphaproteobacteria bacterium]|nr:glycine cleavage system aminomethyltransferase GcvT [Alphaproteobacteria bacterium]